MNYFHPMYARDHTVMPGVGTIHTHGVGAAFTSSLEHTFLAEREEKPVMGRVLFGVRIADDGSTNWIVEEISGPAGRRGRNAVPALSEDDQPDYPAAAIAGMRRISETLEERNPTGWFFDVLQRAERELQLIDRARTELTGSIEQLEKLLRDPSEPRTHFVPKAESGGDKGFNRPATSAERDERREWWAFRIEHNRTALAKHDRELAPRRAMLDVVRTALRSWSAGKAPTHRRLPSTVVAEAVAGHFGRLAA